MNRGSESCAGSSLERNDRFNEAPIHESGKLVAVNALAPAAPSLQ